MRALACVMTYQSIIFGLRNGNGIVRSKVLLLKVSEASDRV